MSTIPYIPDNCEEVAAEQDELYHNIRRQRVRNRLWKAVTLANNPTLVQERLRAWPQQQQQQSREHLPQSLHHHQEHEDGQHNRDPEHQDHHDINNTSSKMVTCFV